MVKSKIGDAFKVFTPHSVAFDTNSKKYARIISYDDKELTYTIRIRELGEENSKKKDQACDLHQGKDKIS